MEEWRLIKIREDAEIISEREDAEIISEKERLATYVALAVAEEIVNNLRFWFADLFSRGCDVHPVMTHRPIEVTNSSDEGKASFQFRFRYDIAIEVHMFNMNTVNREKSEDWVVYEVHFDYWRSYLDIHQREIRYFDSFLLEILQMFRPWESPRVASEAEKILMAHCEELKMTG